MKRWIDLLPAPFNRNPQVGVVMAPLTATSRAISRDRYELGVLEVGERVFGLQVLQPQLATYIAHEDVFRANKIPMAKPEYVGELLTIPQDMLIEEDHVPLVFIRDAMWRPFLHLRRFAHQLTKRKNGLQS